MKGGEAVPDVKPNITYTVTFTAQEFKLIGRALAGLIKPVTKEAREAIELNIALLKVRSAYIDDLKKVADGTLEQAMKEVDDAAAN